LIKVQVLNLRDDDLITPFLASSDEPFKMIRETEVICFPWLLSTLTSQKLRSAGLAKDQNQKSEQQQLEPIQWALTIMTILLRSWKNLAIDSDGLNGKLNRCVSIADKDQNTLKTGLNTQIIESQCNRLHFSTQAAVRVLPVPKTL